MNAAPTWPTSVRGSVSGTPAGQRHLAGVQRQFGHLGRGGGDPAQRPQRELHQGGAQDHRPAAARLRKTIRLGVLDLAQLCSTRGQRQPGDQDVAVVSRHPGEPKSPSSEVRFALVVRCSARAAAGRAGLLVHRQCHERPSWSAADRWHVSLFMPSTTPQLVIVAVLDPHAQHALRLPLAAVALGRRRIIAAGRRAGMAAALRPGGVLVGRTRRRWRRWRSRLRSCSSSEDTSESLSDQGGDHADHGAGQSEQHASAR